MAEPGDDPLDPQVVTLAAVKKFYFDHHVGPNVRSKAASKRAFELVHRYLTGVLRGEERAAMVGDFTLARQEGFWVWCRDKHALSGKSISNYMSSIKAGFRFCARPRIIRDSRGQEREARLLSTAPFVEDSEAAISKKTGLTRSAPREWIPTDAELARIIDAIRDEHVFRYIVMALNTWARPEAITELSVKAQVDFDRGLVTLNPPGRPQNKKVRPTIRLTNNLRGWLLYWNLDRPIIWKPSPSKPQIVVKEINNRTLKKAALAAQVDQWRSMTRYTLRHYMATRIRKVDGVEVSREQRAEWMGHTDPEHRTTQSFYESLDPDYLDAPARATDAVLDRLNSMLRVRTLVPPSAVGKGLSVVAGAKAGGAAG